MSEGSDISFDLNRILEETMNFYEIRKPKGPEDPYPFYNDSKEKEPYYCDICFEKRFWKFKPNYCQCKIDLCQDCILKLERCPTCRHACPGNPGGGED